MSLIAYGGGVNMLHDGMNFPFVDIPPSTAMLLVTLGIALWFVCLAAHVAGMTEKSRSLKVGQSLAISLVSWLVGMVVSGGVFFMGSSRIPKQILTTLVLLIPLAMMSASGMWFLVRIKKSEKFKRQPAQ